MVRGGLKDSRPSASICPAQADTCHNFREPQAHAGANKQGSHWSKATLRTRSIAQGLQAGSRLLSMAWVWPAAGQAHAQQQRRSAAGQRPALLGMGGG